jgi:hypothetical protein
MLGLDHEQQKAAVAGPGDLAAARPALHRPVVPVVDLGIADGAGEAAFQLPAAVDERADVVRRAAAEDLLGSNAWSRIAVRSSGAARCSPAARQTELESRWWPVQTA